MASAKLEQARHVGRAEGKQARVGLLNGATGPWCVRKFLWSCDPSIEGLKDAVQTEVANITNYHTHSATCRKDEKGTYGVRMAGPIVAWRNRTQSASTWVGRLGRLLSIVMKLVANKRARLVRASRY